MSWFNRTVKDRFESKFIPVPESGCWVWEYSVCRKGYGLFNYNGSPRRAHRVSWELYNGPIPQGMHVLHRCDVRECVNPDHLWLGTNNDNMADMKKKGRARGRQGSAHPESKLHEWQVVEMRNLHANGWTLKQLTNRYPVKKSMVGYICSKQNWKHL